ncbi:MAG: hypothetical protein HC888_03960 [Candidatus Competibacteraceae bacterium]|nr:hypothetical protein [Candidatus Competibacteraceae bacterium]
MKGKIIVLGLAAWVLVGCNGVYKLGRVGDKEFYKVKTSDIDGPNTTTIVTRDLDDEVVSVGPTFAGPGPLNSMIGAGATVGAAAARRPDDTNISLSNHSKSEGSNANAAADAKADGGNAEATGGNATADADSRSDADAVGTNSEATIGSGSSSTSNSSSDNNSDNTYNEAW